jgi:signal transduction histidine kinase
MNAGQRTTGGSVPPVVRRPVKDGLLAAGVFLVFLLAHLSGIGAVRPQQAGPVVWIAVGAVMTLSLAQRRRHPLRVWTTVTACGLVLLTDPFPFDSFNRGMTTNNALVVLIAPLIALFTVARADRAHGGFALGGSMVALVLPLLWNVAAWDSTRNALLAGALLVTAWALGETVRTRDESSATRIAALEVEKAEHDRAVAAEERARIARELHDITAHHISVVTLQAGAARLLAESGRMPDVELLSGIETAGRQAMIEIRQALGVIRSSPDGAAPLPGVEQLPDLVGRLGSAGVAVTVDGTAGPLPRGLSLTVYRIVQEGLTNVARHSAACTAAVLLCRGTDTLEVTVSDDGPPRDVRLTSPGGHGLIGLRERVSGYGGELHAGCRPGGGFDLRVALPVRSTVAELTPANEVVVP